MSDGSSAPGPAKQIPPYIKPSEVALACGFSKFRALGLLRRAGALERPGGKGPDEANEDVIREELPAVHARLWVWFVEGGRDSWLAARVSRRKNKKQQVSQKSFDPS